jgi:hypothetical protein
MDARVTLLTLGVASVARSRAFDERLGFMVSGASPEGVAYPDGFLWERALNPFRSFDAARQRVLPT